MDEVKALRGASDAQVTYKRLIEYAQAILEGIRFTNDPKDIPKQYKRIRKALRQAKREIKIAKRLRKKYAALVLDE